jgi:hypothetical protein
MEPFVDSHLVSHNTWNHQFSLGGSARTDQGAQSFIPRQLTAAKDQSVATKAAILLCRLFILVFLMPQARRDGLNDENNVVERVLTFDL